VIGPQPPEAGAEIERRAAEIGAPTYRFGTEWRVAADGGGLVFEGRAGRRACPLPALFGAHQVQNAGIALACAELLGDGFGLSDDAIRAGLTRAEWPGRLQRLARGALAAQLPEGWELWLDGGHNAAAGAALADAAAGWDEAPLHLVYGMLNTKAAHDFLRPLVALTESLRAVAIPGEAASLSAAEAAAFAEAEGFPARPAPSVRDALADIARNAPPGRVLICGSLYLAGRVLAENG
jgi:dihydrofolate synthase/folylpolyglutamate synthase